MSLNWHSQLCQPVCQRLALSVGPVANDVPRWIVVAHPDLPAPISSNGAANRSGLLPYNLRVMAADASTGVAPKIVSARLAGPIANHLGWRRSAPGDGIEVLPIAVVRTVEKVASGDQMISPVLGNLGELVRPHQGWNAHAGANGIVCREHRL